MLPQHPRTYRFTLIELLVVIAIIAILAAILLPALQSSRARGIMASCASNMKNMSVGVMAYSDTCDGYLPPSFQRGHDKWAVSINKFVGKKGDTESSLGDIFRDPAISDDVWNPTQKKSFEADHRTDYGYTLFNGSNLYNNKLAQYTTVYKFGNIPKPSQRPLIADYYNIVTNKVAVMNCFAETLFKSINPDLTNNRHRNIINILNVGGNVEAVRLPSGQDFPRNRLRFNLATW